MLGHGLAGALSAVALKKGQQEPAQRRWLVGGSVALAILPDLDIVIYVLFSPEGMRPHRGFSHSILFGLIASAVAFLLLRPKLGGGSWKVFAVLFAAILSHPLLDYLMGAGPSIPFFAPFSEAGYLFPIKAVPTAYYAKKASSLALLLFYPPTILGMLLELLLFGPLILLALGRARLRRPLLLAIPVFAELVTLAWFNLR